MKKLIYSFLSLAALFTVASCQPDKLIGGEAAYGEGTVNATFAVTLGPQTKAFADGTTVDQLYAGIYEIGGTSPNFTYTWVADNSAAPITISAGAATVTFNGKIALGKSYKVVFWAQKQGAPYTIDWAKGVTTGPTVTATATGAANDETRDAFFGTYETGNVTGSIDLTSSPVSLKRPFAQVNVLVPTDNFVDATAAVTSSMTVAQAPTVLNLATKATSGPADWTFSSAAIDEAAFGTYASTHKYVAMNYVLVNQTAADPRYDVTFSVTSDTQVAADKQVKNTPLKPNGRTNIVGNVFAEDFDITVPIIIDPGVGSEQELTTVTVTVGQSATEAVELTFDQTNPTTTSIPVAVSHPVQVEADKPQITVEPANVATAEWNLTTGKLDVTPLVANGNALITLVFPAVTKTEYTSATVQIYVKVGNGINATPTTLSIEPATLTVKMGNTADFVVTTSEGVGTLGIDPMDNTYFTISSPVQNGLNHTYTVTPKAVTTSPVTVTASGTASTESYSNPAPATIQISVVNKEVVAQSVAFADPKASAITFGDSFTVPTPTASLAPETSLVYSLGEGTTEGAFSITAAGGLTINHAGTAKIVATAAPVETPDVVYSTASDTYTLTVNPKQLVMGTVSCTNDGESVNTLSFSWDAVDHATGYQVSEDGGNNYGSTQDGTTYTLSELDPYTEYAIYVKAIGDGADYTNSEPVSGSGVTKAAPVQKTDQTLTFANASEEVTMGTNYTLQEVSGAQTTVTYTSSEASVATIEGTTVTLVGAGTTTITATAAADDTYNEGTASYTLTVNAPITLSNPSVFNFASIYSAAEGNLELTTETVAPITLTFDKNEAGGGATIPAFNKTSGEVRLYTNNKLTISSERYITKVEFTFTSGYAATSAAFSEEAFNSSTAVWTGSTKSLVIINPSANQIRFTEMTVTWSDDPATWPAVDPALTFAEASESIEVGAKHTQIATSVAGYTGSISYESSDTSVATVDPATGQVTGVAAGTATITASSVANTRFTAGTASYSVTITAAASGPKTETITGTFEQNSTTKALSLTTESGIVIVQEKNGGNDPGASYNTATTLRVYTGNTLSFTAPTGKVITQIQFTNTSSYAGSQGMAANSGSLTTGQNIKWTGSASSVVITNNKGTSSSNVQFRPTQIDVTYE